MIYIIMRQYVRFVLRFFIKNIEVNGMENLPKNGPVMLAGFHPNSFLDGIITNSLISRPVWSLARGDAFKSPFAKKLLSKIYMMPIYRLSEGKEYLGKNDETFERCNEIFKNDGQVLIFSEGLCTNQTELLPLKKGTARLAMQTWASGMEMVIVPVALNYSNYNKPGKNIIMNVGKPIEKIKFDENNIDGAAIKTLNEKLSEGIGALIIREFKAAPAFRNILFNIIYVIHFPVYALLNPFVKAKTKKTVFFDSIYFALLLIALPIYWLIVYLIINALI